MWHLTTVQSIPSLDDAVAFSWVWVVVLWLLTFAVMTGEMQLLPGFGTCSCSTCPTPSSIPEPKAFHLPLSCPKELQETTAPAAPAHWDHTAEQSRAGLGGLDLPGRYPKQPGGGDSERSKESKSSPPNLGEHQFPFLGL